MARKHLPGQTSNIALLITSFWTILGLFILIVGHLAIAFFIYGEVTKTDALAELETYLPFLTKTHLFILAGLAVAGDVWVIISSKKQREYEIKR